MSEPEKKIETSPNYAKIYLLKCQNLEKPVNLTTNSQLSYFLVDNGEKGFGMYLASAYEKMIKSKN